MSEMGELYEAYKEDRKEKKLSNKEWSTKTLRSVGIEFESRNDGTHLIVKNNGYIVDFYPSTGKYIVRNGRKGRGINSLLKILQKSK